MDRRESLKALAVSTITTALALNGCKPGAKEEAPKAKFNPTIDRNKDEKAADEKLLSEQFFTPAEMATIAILCDIIIPADARSGGAVEAKVPDFIEFTAKDKPEFQVTLRGGLRWLEMESIKRFTTSFTDSTHQQRISLIDEIAYPKKAKHEMFRGVNFFNLMRNLTATGYYTSEIGLKDLGYMGNKPNQWNGVPDDVLKQYGLEYTHKELQECVKYT